MKPTSCCETRGAKKRAYSVRCGIFSTAEQRKLQLAGKGQIDGEPRVFRALVYNKAALVLHMLRRLIGDQAFFAGLRRFYNEMRFQIAGTDDLIRAFETEANRSLKDFFERWIFEFDVPSLRFDYRTEARLSGQQGESDVVLRFEQEGQLFEVPVTVTLRYR